MATEVDLIDWRDRIYLARDGMQTFGIVINGPDGEFDPDDEEVTGVWIKETRQGEEIIDDSLVATRQGVGKYEITVRGSNTSEPGYYRLDFHYDIEGDPEVYRVYAVVGEANPAYDNLPYDMKGVVDSVWIKFSDLFDSPAGGPHLQTYYQTHWSRGRMAQLMKSALGRINTMQQPFGSYTLDGVGGAKFPVAQWGPLLETFTYIEAIKHLIRSYVEQPDLRSGTNITYQDRRDYMQRWREVLEMEESMLQSQLDAFKIARLSLSQPSVLVGGGAYGRYAPTRITGMTGRPRYFYRWYA